MNVAPEPQVGHATEGPLAGSGPFAGTLKRPGLTSAEMANAISPTRPVPSTHLSLLFHKDCRR